MKNKLIYNCQNCGAQFPKWIGQCTDCGLWNTLIEEKYIFSESSRTNSRFADYNGANTSVFTIKDIVLDHAARVSTKLTELDLVLGSGLVIGSVVLIGGDPGIGKSTLILQALANLGDSWKTLYVTGEESIQQIAMRAKRLNLPDQEVNLLAETKVERIIQVAEREQPKIIAIDSIQTMYTEMLQSAPGSISQVRDSAAQLMRYAKQASAALFLVGHVTKEGILAGPRVLEHMVDVVLYFEGERDSRYRVVRSIKNRFGAINELGVFAMTDKGLREISNPSSIFLSHSEKRIAGSSIMVAWEGSRPLLVEVQALVDESYLANPKRVSVGLDHNRLAMLLAVLHRHGKVATYGRDIFANVVGGIKVMETAADLALLCAIVSSLHDKPLPCDLVVFGEVGLAGEIRPVQSGQERLKEAVKHGFKRAIIPQLNIAKNSLLDIEVFGVKSVSEALEKL